MVVPVSVLSLALLFVGQLPTADGTAIALIAGSMPAVPAVPPSAALGQPTTTTSTSAAAPSHAPIPRLLVLHLNPRGADTATARSVDAILVRALSQYDEVLDVISSNSTKLSVDFDADRLPSGCDRGACLAELADAVDARLIVFGNVSRVDGLYWVGFSLYDAERDRSLARVATVGDSLVSMEAEIRNQAHAVVVKYVQSRGLPAPALPAAVVFTKGEDHRDGDSPLPAVGVVTGNILFVAGAAALGVGAANGLDYQTRKGTITNLNPNRRDDVTTAAAEHAALRTARQTWNDRGRFLFIGGLSAVCVGGALMVASAAELLGEAE